MLNTLVSDYRINHSFRYSTSALFLRVQVRVRIVFGTPYIPARRYVYILPLRCVRADAQDHFSRIRSTRP